MKLENQLVSLELAKELKENGCPQKGLWCRIENLANLGDEGIKLVTQTRAYKEKCKLFDAGVIRYYVAPTVAELGEALRLNIKENHSWNTWFDRQREMWLWSISKVGRKKSFEKTIGNGYEQFNLVESYEHTEADARAKCWLYLKKENLL